MPDIRFAAADVSAMKLGTTTITKVMHAETELWPATPAGPCTDVLAEPFDHLAAWSTLSAATIVAGGRTGFGAQITGAGAATYLFAANESAYLTCGFAYQVTNLSAARSIILLRSDNGGTTQLTVMVTTGGALEVRRGGTGGTVIGTTATGLVAAATWVYIEIQVFLDDTAGTVLVNVDGSQRLSIGPVDTRFGGAEGVFDGITVTGTSGANNLFDDLYLSTGSGCMFQGDHTVPSTTAFKSSLGNRAETVSGTTVVITTTNPIAVDDLVVVRVAADNLNATTPTFTCADSAGNTYTTHAQKAQNATAAAGVAGAIMCSRVTNPVAAGGTITVTLSGARDARVAYAESFIGYLNTTRSTPASASAASTAPAVNSGAVSAGDLIVAACAVETRTAPTGDSDTTASSPWSTLVQIPNIASGTDTSAVLVSGQYKIAGIAAAIQGYNQTTVSTDWAAMVVVLQRA